MLHPFNVIQIETFEKRWPQMEAQIFTSGRESDDGFLKISNELLLSFQTAHQPKIGIRKTQRQNK